MDPGPTLMIKTHALGDVLMTTAAVAAFRRRFPGMRLDYLTGARSAPALEANPHLTALIRIDEAGLLARRPAALAGLWRAIRRGGYRTAILFQPAPLMRAAVAVAGVRRRIGLASGPARLLTRAVVWGPDGDRYAGEWFLDLVRALGVEAGPARPELHLTPDERVRAGARLAAAGLERAPFALLCPGGGRNVRDTVLAKRWPAERFAALARELAGRGLAVGVAGGAGDEEAMAAVVAGAGGAAAPLGGPDSTFRELAALIGAARLLVTNDSAPLHAGIALGTPTVAIFGPTRPAALVPAGAAVAAVASPLECAPCYANAPFPGCRRPPPACAAAVPGAEVLAAALRLIERTA